MAISKLSILKSLEMLLTFTCLSLHYNCMKETDQHTILLTAGTYVGYSVILVALFAGYLMSTPINKRLDIFFSLIGSAMFIAAGALVIKEWENAYKTDDRKMGMAKGSVSIINGIIFLVDIVLTFRE